MAPTLSIIVVHYKTPQLLTACLRSLIRTIHTTTHEIIVVDVASDGTVPALLAAQFPHVRCISVQENTGFGKGLNLGMAQAHGTFFLALNPDIEALDDAIDRLVAFAEQNPSCGMMGPRLLETNGDVQYSAFRFYTPFTILCRRTPIGKTRWGKQHLRSVFLEDKNITAVTTPQRIDWLMGSALLVRKDAVGRVGGMDERFFMYFEDIDWARRFWDNGYAVMYVPQSRMRHHHLRESHRYGMLDAITNPLTRAHIISGIKYFLKYRLRIGTHHV